MRFLLAAACIFALACDPIEFATFQVAPQASGTTDSTAQRAFAVVTRVGTRRGLVASEDARKDGQGWKECLTQITLVVCGKVRGGEAQFQMRQWHSFSPDALNLKRELLDSLRREFGDSNVRECAWKDQRPLTASGCAPLSPAERAVPPG